MGIRFTPTTDGYPRTNDYRFTVDSKDDPAIAELKRSVSTHNKWVRGARRKGFNWADGTCTLRRVRIKPRGPRLESVYHTMTEDATHFDIYVGVDTEAEYQLNREIETGCTPGELRRIDKLRNEARLLEWQGMMRKRNNTKVNI